MKKIVNTFEFINRNGIHAFVKELYCRQINNLYEKYFNVNTKGLIPKEQLGITNSDSVEYSSVLYTHIFKMLNKLPVDKKNATLLDYGCGKGRVMISAASYQYKKIIGVELSDLIHIARNNIDKMKHRNTKSIELIQCDAKYYKIPGDVNIIYFFNPFRGELLENVIENIYSSYKETSRKIYIIYFNNDHFDKLMTSKSWLTKTYQTEFHLNISCGLYETVLSYK